MNILEKYGINPSTLGLLQFVKLNTGKEGFILNIIRSHMFEFQTDNGQKPHEMLESMDLIKYIKTGRKDPWFRIRLSKKGETILREMNQRPTHDLAEMTLEYIRQEYLRVGAENLVSGGDKMLFYISEFLYHKEKYTERMVRAVIKSYVESFEYDRTYMNAMKTLFYKPGNVYATKWTPEECPLNSFIEKNQPLIKSTYKKYE